VIRFICGTRLQGAEIGDRILDRDIIAHEALGQQHDTSRPLLADIIGHCRSRACEIAFGDDFRRALRVGQHDDPGMALPQAPDVLRGKRSCTSQRPFQAMISTLVCARYCGEILVGQHEHARTPSASMIFLACPRCSRYPTRPSPQRGIHVGHHRHAGMPFAQQSDVRGRDRGGKRAARPRIGDQHGLFRVQELGGLGHEMKRPPARSHRHRARRLARQARLSPTMSATVWKMSGVW